MAALGSRVGDQKALQLCKERKRLMKHAHEGRSALAASHVSYIQSLKNIGTAVRQFVEVEIVTESSLNTSTAATPEPPALIEKSLSDFSIPSPYPTQHIETNETHYSPTPSSPDSGRFGLNYSKSGEDSTVTIEERPQFPVTVASQSDSARPHESILRPTRTSELVTSVNTLLPPPPPPPPSYDFFCLGNENQLSPRRDPSDDKEIFRRFGEKEGISDSDEEGEKMVRRPRKTSSLPPLRSWKCFDEEREREFSFTERISDDEEDMQRLRTEEGIPELEEDGEEGRLNMEGMDRESSPVLHALKIKREQGSPSLNHRHLRGNKMIENESIGSNEMPYKETQSVGSVVGVAIQAGDKEAAETQRDSKIEVTPKDFLTSMKEIEGLFVDASESGKKVSKMLEATKWSYQSRLAEVKARKSLASKLLSSCLECWKGEPPLVPPEPVPSGVKFLTWHRSGSSRSSSSRYPIGMTAKDEMDDSSSDPIEDFCMISGSHASTLDRLFAWERKLYDEVKALDFIGKEYKRKCTQLRHQQARDENETKVNATRAGVKELYSRIMVSIHVIESISKRIEKLRDEELHPQLQELFQGLLEMWSTMHERHNLQLQIISVAYVTVSSTLPVQSEHQQQAAAHLEFELYSLSSSFVKWIESHKSYILSLHGWLMKCILPPQEKSSKGRRSTSWSGRGHHPDPPIFVMVREWSESLKASRVKEVADSIKELAAKTHQFLPTQDDNSRNNLKRVISKSSSSLGLNRTLSYPAGNPGLSGFRSSLEPMFEKLKAFSDSSVKEYERITKEVGHARKVYESGTKRMYSNGSTGNVSIH
ncbi:uncharacterized protein LOC18427078 [Amborella trichopoda]|uniref:DUF632 domain-containing protein n=1 Tax=Amborella trichopoda TaxID=13333 RepID=W1NU05_AMBTC|nr:uncharacterized protein LOC18427078 [Amborella trichopoda]ERM99052.1 hypothetical protein AMTR_s00101p00076180 [Amborella trichopoda]|eukprot:XP_006836199.1 uncharacterized protein LOC18427078 [Amborella trichopoda]